MLGDSLYLDNIQEYVHDEDKIVSYKWLSRKLDVPVNAAKQMLYAYVCHYRSLDSSNEDEAAAAALHVTYTVSGLTREQAHQVTLVDEDQLEASKKQFEEVIGVHVYSIQKSKIKDSGVLYMANYDTSKQHLPEYSRWNTIDCGNVSRSVAKPVAKGRSSPEKKSNKAQLPRLSHVKEKDGAPNGTSPDVALETKSIVEIKSKVEVKQPPPSKKGSGAKQKAKGVASFFGKAQTKTAEDEKVSKKSTATATEVAPVEKSKEAKKEIKPKGIIIEISPKKSPVKSPRKRGRPPKSSKLTASQTTLLHDSDLDIDDEDSDDTERKNQDEEPAVKSRKKKHDTVKSSKVKPSATNEVSRAKKRKRVQTMSSDEEASDSEKAPTTSAPTTSGGGDGGGGRRRKRVKRMVSKVHVNEDGEMVTERSSEFISTDESGPEEAGGAGGNGGSSPTVKSESPLRKAGTKQSSLTSFFKK